MCSRALACLLCFACARAVAGDIPCTSERTTDAWAGQVLRLRDVGVRIAAEGATTEGLEGQAADLLLHVALSTGERLGFLYQFARALASYGATTPIARDMFMRQVAWITSSTEREGELVELSLAKLRAEALVADGAALRSLLRSTRTMVGECVDRAARLP